MPQDELPIMRVQTRGAVRVSRATIVKQREGIVLLAVDLHSKYCEVAWYITGTKDAPGLGIVATKESLYLDERRNRVELTEIVFPRWPGWSVFSASAARYTVGVCLVDKLEIP